MLLEVGLSAAAERVGLNRDPAGAGAQPARRSCARCWSSAGRCTREVARSRSAPRPTAAERRRGRGDAGDARALSGVRAGGAGDSPPACRCPVTRPYDVVVGEGLLGELAPALTGAAAGGRGAPGRARWRPPRRSARTCSPPGFEALLVEVPDGEASKDLHGRGLRSGTCSAQVGLTRSDAVVAVGGGATTDLAGFVGRHLAARGPRGAPADDAARHGRRGGRRQDRHQHRRRQEPGRVRSTRRRPCCATSPRCETVPRHDYVAGLAEVIKVGFTHDPRILELVEAGPAGRDVPPGRAAHPRAGRAGGGASRPAWSARTSPSRAPASSSTTATPSGTPSRRSRTTAGGTVPRCRSGWCSPPSSAASPGGSTTPPPTGTAPCCRASGCPRHYAGDWCRLLAAMRVDKKSRGNRLRFVVLDGLARVADARGPRPGAARRRLRRGPQGPRPRVVHL